MLKNKRNVELWGGKSDEFVIKIKVLMELTHVFTKHLGGISMGRLSIADKASRKSQTMQNITKTQNEVSFFVVW